MSFWPVYLIRKNEKWKFYFCLVFYHKNIILFLYRNHQDALENGGIVENFGPFLLSGNKLHRKSKAYCKNKTTQY